MARISIPVIVNVPVEDIIERLKEDGKLVEVVRCRDCKWWTKQKDSLQGLCELNRTYPTGAWYCANGERNEQKRTVD